MAAKQFSYDKKMGCGIGAYLLINFLLAACGVFLLLRVPEAFQRAINALPGEVAPYRVQLGWLHGALFVIVCATSMAAFNANRWAIETLFWLKAFYLLGFVAVMGLQFMHLGQSVFFSGYGPVLLLLVGDLVVLKVVMHQNEGAFQAKDKYSKGLSGGKKAAMEDQGVQPGAGSSFAVDAAFSQMASLDDRGGGPRKPADFRGDASVGTLQAGKSLYDSARIAAVGGQVGEGFKLLDQAVIAGFADPAAIAGDEALAKLRDANPALFDKIVAKAQKAAAKKR